MTNQPDPLAKNMQIPFRARRLAEYLSRNIVLKRSLPERFHSLPVYISPGASMIYWKGLRQSAFDDLYDFATHYVNPGDTVWDVGANVGLFSFAAAARAQSSGRVICLEPDSWSVQLLRRSSKANRHVAASVDVIPVAAGDRVSLEWLCVPKRSRASSHLESNGGGAGHNITGGVRERHLTPVITLDWLSDNAPPPDVLKIDVDGGELTVLRGGLNMLAKKRPVILTEVYDRNADAVTSLLHDLGYKLFHYEAGEAGKRPTLKASYNTLAIPS